jgi:hypothetical protein
MMRVIERHTLYRDSRFYAAFPGVCRTASGTILLAFRQARDSRWASAARPDFDLQGFASHLDPRSRLVTLELAQDLSEIRPLGGVTTDPEAADQDATLLTLPCGALLLFSYAWYPMPAPDLELTRRSDGSPPDPWLRAQAFSFVLWGATVRRSEDAGLNWSAPRVLPPVPGALGTVPGARPDAGGSVRGRAIIWQDEVLVAGYGWHPTLPGGAVGTHLYRGTDRARTWTFGTPIARDLSGAVSFFEPALALAANGDIVAFLRTSGADDRIATTRSTDGGRSFGPWQLHETRGHPCDPLPLADGRVLLVYGYRHAPFGIRARLLDPDLGSIDDAEELIISDDGVSSDLGYPSAVELDDGRVLVVFYDRASDDVRLIAAAVIVID